MSDVQEFKGWRMDFESDYDAKPTPFQAWQAAKESSRKQVEELQAKLAMQDGALRVLKNELEYLAAVNPLPHQKKIGLANKAISATSEDVAAWQENQLAPLQREVAMLSKQYHALYAIAVMAKSNRSEDWDKVSEGLRKAWEFTLSLRDTQATAEAYEQKIRTEVLFSAADDLSISGLDSDCKVEIWLRKLAARAEALRSQIGEMK